MDSAYVVAVFLRILILAIRKVLGKHSGRHKVGTVVYFSVWRHRGSISYASGLCKGDYITASHEMRFIIFCYFKQEELEQQCSGKQTLGEQHKLAQ